MSAYKEIVTKAIVGKGKKLSKNSYTMQTENNPTNILGAWIINHKFKGYKKGSEIGVDGSFDVNVWYSYENDTKTAVSNQTIEYDDTFNVKIREDADLSSDTDIIVRTLKQPTCYKVNIENGNNVSFDIEKELGVEVVGETKMKIAVEEDEEPWEDLAEDSVMEEIDKNVNENFIETKSN